ncbi:hypothetical protein V5740_12210 [Croceibacterium sp. TMG7-5b_MA50]|uniref:GTA baseplate fiber-binding domain-containing protein n=1 Tax=Croceibacterium sp. TMG7-5b_MA50 TaxID=3121290 RepID=UPI003222132D
MATLLLSTLGTAVGGPLGGAAGALLGNQVDRTLGGSAIRNGARLQDLTATTSAYGQAVPRHFGRVRAPGTIIWATELAEQRAVDGGGKGQPAVTSYSYTVSFAVALASRPIVGLGRVWADGQLLRGAAGDLKVGGVLRVHGGHGDQQPDPLIAADIGDACPAFRGIAYCVFEGLQLASFGNRIPALTFEILADDEEVTLAEVIEPAGGEAQAATAFPGLIGWSHDGGSLAGQLDEIGQLYPLCIRHGEKGIEIAGCGDEEAAIMLPEAALSSDVADDGTLLLAGLSRRNTEAAVPAGIRYYDVARDHQIGTQLTGARSPGFNLLDFAGTMESGSARLLANRMRQRIEARSDGAVWRMVELDPQIAPGAIVQLPDRPGRWCVETWELDAQGVVVELVSVPPVAAQASGTDAGAALPQPDEPTGPTILAALELPPFSATDQGRQIHAAVSADANGWSGAALYREYDGDLVTVGHARAPRSRVGVVLTALAPSSSMLLDRDSFVDVRIAADLPLDSVSADDLAAGANRALIGEEIIQFVKADPLGNGGWRLTGLLRGRGGTEQAARQGQAAGGGFVLLDETLVPIDMRQVPPSGMVRLAAIGLADDEPAMADVANTGGSIRPMTPVHLRRVDAADGAIRFRWTERISGAWSWPDVPAATGVARWQVGIGPADAPVTAWFVEGSMLDLPAATLRDLKDRHAAQPMWVRQVGREAMSDPLTLMSL